MKYTWRWWHDGYDVQLPLLKPWFKLQRGQIHSLIAMKLACSNDEGGGSRVSWLLQNGESRGCGNGGAGVCCRLLMMGCDSFVMPVCGSLGSGEPGSRMGYQGNILVRLNGGRWSRDRKPNFVGGEGRGRDRKPDFVACSMQIVSRWVVVEWGIKSYSGLAGNTYFVYLALRTSALGMGQTVRLGKRNTLCCKSRMEIYFYLVLWFFIFYLLFIIYVRFLQNHQVMMTSLGLCCWSGSRVSQSPDCWCSCNIRGKMREGGEDDDKGMFSVIEGVRSLGGREMSSPMRDGIVLKYKK